MPVQPGFELFNLNIQYLPHGRKIESQRNQVSLKIEGNKVFYQCPNRGSIIELDFKVKSSAGFSTPYTSDSISFYAFNFKWAKKLEEFFLVNLTKEIYD